MNGARNVKFFGPAPWGPGEGSKGQISLNFNYIVNVKDFYFQTLCVFSLMKDTKHIRRVFYSAAWVMPYGWDLGVLRGQNQILSCCLSVMLSTPKPLDEIKPNYVCELLK